jgi:hypothetical protein
VFIWLHNAILWSVILIMADVMQHFKRYIIRTEGWRN